MQLLVGHIYQIKPDFLDVCGNVKCLHSKKIKVTHISDYGGIDYDILDENFVKIGSCCGCVKERHLEEEEIVIKQGEILEPTIKTKPMALSKKVIAQLSASDQKLLAAGFYNDDLELTAAGKKALDGINVTANITALASLADEEVAAKEAAKAKKAAEKEEPTY